MRPNRATYQVVISLMPGAEPWIRVQHSWGWFKLPVGASVDELWRGTVDHWTSEHKSRSRATATMRIPVAEWYAIKPTLDALRRAGRPSVGGTS